jgi:hypothetical protein
MMMLNCFLMLEPEQNQEARVRNFRCVKNQNFDFTVHLNSGRSKFRATRYILPITTRMIRISNTNPIPPLGP